MLAAGDVFLVPDPEDSSGLSSHARVIVSDPSEDSDNLVMVTLTSWETYKEDTCLLDPKELGGISFFRHRSCAEYRRSFLMPASTLLVGLNNKVVRKLGSVPAAALARLRKGAAESPQLPQKCANILARQGLA